MWDDQSRQAPVKQASVIPMSGQLGADLGLQSERFSPQAGVLDRSKSLLGEEANLVDRIGARVMAEHAQLGGIIVTKAVRPSGGKDRAAHCRQAQGAAGANLQKIAPIHHQSGSFEAKLRAKPDYKPANRAASSSQSVTGANMSPTMVKFSIVRGPSSCKGRRFRNGRIPTKLPFCSAVLLFLG